MHKLYTLLAISSLTLSSAMLSSCGVVAVSGAATGAAIVYDRRTAGTIFDDKSIEVKAQHAFSKNKRLWESSHISVVSYNNVVLLVGQVPTMELKQQATEALKSIPKIATIYNELEIGEPVSYAIRSKDSWITTQIKTKLINAKQANVNQSKIVTENGVVYLMGLVNSAEEEEITAIARNVNGVEKVVQLFEIVR